MLCVDGLSGIGIFASNWLVDRDSEHDSEHDGIMAEDHILSYFKLVFVMMKTASKKIPQTTRDFNYFIENILKSSKNGPYLCQVPEGRFDNLSLCIHLAFDL